MNHVKTKTSGKRWWWWMALACTCVILMIISSSYFWLIKWMEPIEWPNSPRRSALLIGNGVLKIIYYGPLDSEDIDSRYVMSVYDFNLHILLFITIPIVIYPYLPYFKKRQRREHGLCVKCAYDLTGNESGTCPECGTQICR